MGKIKIGILVVAGIVLLVALIAGTVAVVSSNNKPGMDLEKLLATEVSDIALGDPVFSNAKDDTLRSATVKGSLGGSAQDDGSLIKDALSKRGWVSPVQGGATVSQQCQTAPVRQTCTGSLEKDNQVIQFKTYRAATDMVDTVSITLYVVK